MTGEDFTIVNRKDWGKHPLLSLIKSGSDMDGDGAFFIPEDEVNANPVTKLIQMQALNREGDWIDIPGGPGGTFPSRGWARAGLSWYRWESLSGTDLNDHMEFRVVVPREVLEHDLTTSMITFRPEQEFYDIDLEVLLPRLRLDPEIEFLDVFEAPIVIYLADEPILDVDITSTLGAGPDDGELCSWGNGGEIGGRCDIYGGWLHLFVPGISDEYTWIGFGVDLSELARERIVDGLNAWEPEETDPVELTSPYLDVNNPVDVEWVRSVAPGATLNGIVIR